MVALLYPCVRLERPQRGETPNQQVGRGGVACRVQRVDYELPARGDASEPPLVAAVATLLASGSGASGGEHEVSLRPSECADFLVPRRKVLQVINWSRKKRRGLKERHESTCYTSLTHPAVVPCSRPKTINRN